MKEVNNSNYFGKCFPESISLDDTNIKQAIRLLCRALRLGGKFNCFYSPRTKSVVLKKAL
jgi:hypothetical protein